MRARLPNGKLAPIPTGSPGQPSKMENDQVNHPEHYTNHPSGIECIEIARHMGFNRGNAIKYIWRAGGKGGEIQDLQKAIWYLQDEINRIGGGGKTKTTESGGDDE